MKNLLRYIIVTALGLTCLFLWLKGCNSGPSELERYQDSLRIEKALNDTIKLSQKKLVVKLDSTYLQKTNDSVRFTKKIDSLQTAYQKLQSRWGVTKDSIFNLNIRLNQLADNIDNPQLKEVVQRLGGQLQDANQQLFYIQINRDSLDNAKTLEIVRLNGVIDYLQKQLADLNKLLIQCTENTSNMAKTTDKVIKKTKARNLLLKISGTLNIVLAAILAIAK